MMTFFTRKARNKSIPSQHAGSMGARMHDLVRRLTLAAALLAAFVPATAAEKSKTSDPAEQFRTAYSLVQTADNFLEQSFADDACEAYMDALQIYEQIARKHPTWNKDVVAFRINYCQDRLEKIFLGRTEAFQARPADQEWKGLQWSSELLEQVPEARPAGFEQTMKAAAGREKGGDFAAALPLYEAAMQIEPASMDAVHGAARCCLALGLIKRGQDHLHAAVARAPDNPETILLLAELACAERDFTKALRTLAPAVATHPENARLHCMFGVANMGLGRLDRAEESLQTAVKLDPNLSVAHYNLARLLVMREPVDLTAAHRHYLASVRSGGEKDANLEKLFATLEEGLQVESAAGSAASRNKTPEH